MTPQVEAAITQAANEAGIDPAFALATADRESRGGEDPNTYKPHGSIYGLFQMSGPLRQKYGIGNSTDPYTQAKGWAAFMNDTRGQLAKTLGRAPTDQELYLAHYFGAGRAGRLIGGNIPPTADVRDVFTPQELAQNPEIAKAGTVGALMSSVNDNMATRMAAFNQPAGDDLANYGVNENGDAPPVQTAGLTGSTTVAPVAPVGLSPMDATRYRAIQNDEGFDPGNVSAPVVPGTGVPDPEFGGTDARPVEVSQAPQAESPEPIYGMSPPMAQAMMANPGYRAEMMARMRGGMPGQEVDYTQFGAKPGNNLQNPGLVSNVTNPAIDAALQPQQQQQQQQGTPA